ncbi:MAG: HEAT repeat domain-containing protein [Anaerolineae bacterium]|nr:HEAT repeat domain-containing protein [Anaerolineae bacterium]
MVIEFDDFLDNDEDVERLREKPDLDTTLNALRSNVDGSADATLFYGLAGLTMADASRAEPVWNGLPAEVRRKLLRHLVDISESNFELDYRSLGTLALGDEDAEVRATAIDLLWDDDTLELMNRLIDLAQWDESIQVRATAIEALGRFILLGELGDLPEIETIRAQDAAVNLLTNLDEDVDVRRRALEAIANCGHEIVNEAIDEAYTSDDPRMQASALYAMGRTCDNRWDEIVLREIDHIDPAIRYEAARASGELEIEEAVPHLARLVQGHDREIKEVAIWSLGEIGGSYALKILGALADEAEQDDDDLLEAIEEALGNASLAGRDFDFDLDD